MIGQVDWADLIEPVSHSLRVLRELPSFARESELTRQQITHAMEQVARQQRHGPSARWRRRWCGWPLARARRRAGSTERAERTAGYHLFGPGRAALRGRAAPPARAAAPRAQPLAAAPSQLAPAALPGCRRSAARALLLAAVAHAPAPHRLAALARLADRRWPCCCWPGRCRKR